MFVRKKTILALLTKSIIETARACGKNLSLKDQAKIKNKFLNENRKIK